MTFCAIILTTLLIFSKNVHLSEQYSCSRAMERECGVYCYQIVKPLLSYAASVKSKEQQFEDMQNKITKQEMIINNLNEFIKQKEFQLAQQIELNVFYKNSNKDKDNLLKAQTEISEGKISHLQAKVKEIQTQVKNKEDRLYSSSSCLGKLTNQYLMQVPNSEPFVVPCDSKLAGSGWLVIQRRVDGVVDFNCTWIEYRAGFGDLNGNFFIGLEKLYLLLKSQPYELYIHLESFGRRAAFARYSHFVIGSESELYELKKLGNYAGNAGDSLGKHINMKFTTPDRDNDIYPKHNCALIHKSGWWFSDCVACNLNGIYYMTNADIDMSGINWLSWKFDSLRFVQMMIRPKLI